VHTNKELQSTNAACSRLGCDTPAFAAHAISHWWVTEGVDRCPRSRQLLILSDTGGSNGCRCRTWKTELQSQLANPHGLTLTVAHYPTVLPSGTPLNTAPLFRDFQKLGGRTARQLSEDPAHYPLYQNRNRAVRYRAPRPPTLSCRRRTNIRATRIAAAEPPRGSSQMELYDLAQYVKLILRQPLHPS
jgi:hypothetical protein